MTELSLLRPGYGNELLMLLNVLPILGPSKRMTAITTMAMSARMIAYSTKPWPFSLGAKSIITFLSIKKSCLRIVLSSDTMTHVRAKSYIGFLRKKCLPAPTYKISKLPSRQNLITSNKIRFSSPAKNSSGSVPLTSSKPSCNPSSMIALSSGDSHSG